MLPVSPEWVSFGFMVALIILIGSTTPNRENP